MRVYLVMAGDYEANHVFTLDTSGDADTSGDGGEVS